MLANLQYIALELSFSSLANFWLLCIMDGLAREPTERIDTTIRNTTSKLPRLSSCERKNYESQGETPCTTKYKLRTDRKTLSRELNNVQQQSHSLEHFLNSK